MYSIILIAAVCIFGLAYSEVGPNYNTIRYNSSADALQMEVGNGDTCSNDIQIEFFRVHNYSVHNDTLETTCNHRNNVSIPINLLLRNQGGPIFFSIVAVNSVGPVTAVCSDRTSQHTYYHFANPSKCLSTTTHHMRNSMGILL